MVLQLHARRPRRSRPIESAISPPLLAPTVTAPFRPPVACAYPDLSDSASSSAIPAPIAVILVFVWCTFEALSSSPLADDDGEEVKQPHHTGSNAVSDDGRLSGRHESVLCSEEQPKAAVDNSQGDDDSAEPDMAV